MKTPIYVAKPTLPPLQDFVDRLSTIWESVILTNSGFYANKLEEELKKYLKTENLSITDNGTIAIMIAIRALRLSGSIITTPFTFPATISAIEWCGLKPIFCDIDLSTGNIDSSKIEKLIQNDTTAIVPVHVFGVPCDVYSIEKIALKYGLKVIYDAAHTFGVEIDGKALASFGDISTMSFHATKLFYTAEGGAIISNSKDVDTRIKLLRNFGINSPEEVLMSGINGKMSELNAALGTLVLDKIDIEIKKRKDLFYLYKERLSDIPNIETPSIPKNVTKWNYQYFFIRTCERDALVSHLAEKGIFARKYFYPICSGYSGQVTNIENAVALSNVSMVLPLYGSLEENDVNEICNIIHDFFTKIRG